MGDYAEALATLIPALLGPVEAAQATTGGSNPRTGTVFEQPHRPSMPEGMVEAVDQPTCVIVTDDADLGRAVARTVTKWGMRPVGVGSWEPFDDSATVLPAEFAETAATLSEPTGSRAV